MIFCYGLYKVASALFQPPLFLSAAKCAKVFYIKHMQGEENIEGQEGNNDN